MTKINNKLRFADILKREIFRLYRKSKVKEHELTYLFWECTLRCNLSCRHCGSDCLKDSEVRDMPLADFVAVLDTIKKSEPKHLTVCITGGEPLLRQDLEQAGLEIMRRGFSWGIVSNALALTPERFFSLRRSGLSSMSVSIDGLAQEHAFLRQNPKSFEKVSAAIDLMVHAHTEDPRGFIFDVITCVHRGNLGGLRKLRDFLLEKGVYAWRIFSIFPSGRACENDLALSSGEYRALMEFIAETRQYKDSMGRSIRLNYSCEGYLGAYELKVRDFFFFCRAGVNVASVMCDGSISACLSVRAKDFIQGNIYTDDFMEVWNKRYKNMRNRKWARTGRCKKCRSWRYCEGNGIHLHKDARSECERCNLALLTD